MKIASRVLCCISAVVVLASLSVCHAQNLSGMAGDVSDASGAAVPGVTVTLENKTTGAKFSQTTNGIGFYRFSEIPPGQGYDAIFSAKGFATLTVKDIYLTVATIRTQNASLQVSTRQEQVEVTATSSEVTIDTTSATIGNTFDVTAINNLPVQQRNDPTALFTMQPGVTSVGAVTGARVDQNYITLDGLDVNDLATGGASQSNTGAGITEGFSNTIVGHAPVDSVEEFHATVSGTEANTGLASGGQFQLVTRSGTNSFHGNVNEYHRDEDLVANSWFSNNSDPIIPRNHLIQNQFGGNIGGPIKRNKAFFFFNYSNSKIISGVLVQRTVPLDSLRNGNISYCTNASDDCSTKKQLTPAQVKAFDPSGIGEDTNWVSAFSARFPHSNNSITGDGVNSGGFNFNAPDNDYETNYVGRVDYNITDNMKAFARFTISRENSTQFPNEFAGDPSTDPFVDRTYAFVVGLNSVFGQNKTNRFYLGEVVEKYSYPNQYNPDGSTFFTFGDGADEAIASSLYLNPAAQARRVPNEMIGDDFSITTGRHTWQFGGTFKDILAHDTVVADYNSTEVGLGGNIFALCGPAAGDCGGANPSLRPSDIDTGNTIQYDEALAFMVGRLGQISSDYNYDAHGKVLAQLTGDQRFYQYYQTQMYLEDLWKVTPSLSISSGLNWQWFTVPYETRGLETVEPYTFNQYFQARVEQSDSGQTGPDAVPLISYLLGGKANGGPGLFPPQYRNFAPHVGIIWNPPFDKKSVFNAGGGIVYDRTVIFAVQALQDAYSYLFQQTKTTSLGTTGDPYDSIKSGPRLDSKNNISTVPLTPPATPTPPYQPFVSGGVPFGLQSGGAFNETIDPALNNPYSITYNAGWQRSLPGDMVLKVSYVGRLGRRLLAQADANQVLDFPDPKSGQMLSAALAAVTTQLRAGVTAVNLTTQPWFEDVLDPNLGSSYGFKGNTQYLGSGSNGALAKVGDFGDFVQALSNVQESTLVGSDTFATPPNVGSAAQFSENSFHNNQGFSSYSGFLVTLQKNMSHGLHYDFNYTLSHSIDNISFFANSQGDTGIGGGGLICDVVRPRICRGVSDFDVRNYITTDALYQLPFGKGKMFLGTAPFLVNEFIGGWSVSGVGEWHGGFPWQTSTLAFDASYSNDAAAIYTGTNRSVIQNKLTKLKGGGVSDFANASAAAKSFTGPLGFLQGPRNSMRGPGYFNADMGLAKTFPITAERLNLRFRADAFNVLNHPNFQIPSQNLYNGLDGTDYRQGVGFGQISYTVTPAGNLNNGARVLELSLRLEF